MLNIYNNLYFFNKSLLKEVNSIRKIKTPQLFNKENFPANTREITQNTLWGILIWNRRLFVVWIQFISRVFTHNKLKSPCYYIFRSSLAFLLEILIDSFFLKKLLVVVMWFFERRMSLKKRIKNIVRWKLAVGQLNTHALMLFYQADLQTDISLQLLR